MMLIPIEKFTITSIDTNLQINRSNVFEKGIYLIEFNVSENKVEELSYDTILLKYKQQNLTKSLKTTVKNGKLITLK
ncbi:MAG: hypothetical protein HC798_02090 [Polaribacter sp.]|nr:hypothetical protein [Polaribacter sp.]